MEVNFSDNSQHDVVFTFALSWNTQKGKPTIEQKTRKMGKRLKPFFVGLYWVDIICIAHGYFFLPVHRVKINLFSYKYD